MVIGHFVKKCPTKITRLTPPFPKEHLLLRSSPGLNGAVPHARCPAAVSPQKGQCSRSILSCWIRSQRNPLVITESWVVFFFLYSLLSSLFITAKHMFNGKTSQRMSPRGPALFWKVFMSVYIMLWFIFRLAEACYAGPWTKPICFPSQEAHLSKSGRRQRVASREPISLAAWRAGRLLSQGCQLVHLSDFYPNFSKLMGKFFFLVVLHIQYQPRSCSWCSGSTWRKRVWLPKPHYIRLEHPWLSIPFPLVCSPSAGRICPEVCITSWRTI